MAQFGDTNIFTWKDIEKICQMGKANKYFKPGQERVIRLEDLQYKTLENIKIDLHDTPETIPSQTAIVRIMDISEDGKRIKCMISEYSHTNPKCCMEPEIDNYPNKNGWEGTLLRKWLNEDFFAALPVKLQEVIKPHKVLTITNFDTAYVMECWDKLSLPSVKEIFGDKDKDEDSDTGFEHPSTFKLEKQYQFYENAGVTLNQNFKSTMKYKPSFLSYTCNEAIYYWLRSPARGVGGSHGFCIIGPDGRPNGAHYPQNMLSIFPVFEIRSDDYETKTFDECEWNEIQDACNDDKADMFKVGDRKTINLTNLVSMESIELGRVVGKNLPSNTATIEIIESTKTKLVFKFVEYEHTLLYPISNNDYVANLLLMSYLNDDHLGSFYSSLPNGLKENMAEVLWNGNKVKLHIDGKTSFEQNLDDSLIKEIYPIFTIRKNN
jgi:hypothetical protein